MQIPVMKPEPGQGGVIYAAPEGEDARILAARARELATHGRALIHIAQDDSRMAVLASLLAFFAPDVEVAEFPAWDCLPYDRVSPDGGIVARRVAALAQVMAWQDSKPRILLATVNAAAQRVMPRAALKNAAFIAGEKDRIDLEGFRKFLAHNGYLRADTVREAGEYAMRGGIIDLFPPGYAEPLRIDLFGDEIESIKNFDPATQLTTGRVKSFSLLPVAEFFMDEDSIARFRTGYRRIFGVIREDDPLYESVSQGRRYNGMEHWLPLFHEKMETIFDYLPRAGVTCDQHAIEARGERLAQIKDFYEARKTLEESGRGKKEAISGALYRPLPVNSLYIGESWPAGETLSPFAAPGSDEQGAKKGRDFADIRAMPDGDVFGELKNHMATLDKRRIIIAAYSEGSASRLKGLMEHAGIENPEIVILPLEHGFVAKDLAVITEQDILGDRLARRTHKKRRADNFLSEVSALSEGDLVVHMDHGIGKFIALETLEAGKKLHDCLKIEYAGGDRLFVPVENIEVLSRFGADEGTVQLDKLGGAGWQARKSRVKKDLMIMAGKLLEIAAARKLRRAPQFETSGGSYDEFAAKFSYQETEDQQRAITDVLASLSGEYPMDRLVCGDVGFGKTEVALRAAYAAAMSGAQVAVAVPTTLLARQHYRNFKERFAGTGMRVEQISRLVSPRERTEVKKGLADGSVNIVIGTHALFGAGIKFANLGLLIVDEEQRFGVKQKERLKELKNNVHVLTLTATPIPRTLQMALTGVKEMSLIATPPVDRLAVRTFVLPFDPVVIREALLREHYRGGQSFYVCPRVSDLKEVEEMLKELVPEVKIISAHGQLHADDLEDRMGAFYDRQYDVLLATNIIESGLDIPNANTMVIHRADMFGLSQLYQLRGRIGRSKQRAYAYLTYAPGILLNPQAQKRLEVIGTLDTLGSGFQLASHDMDIRGAGNLLGEQQSGHIREVGVELYQQMLEEAVAAAREGAGQQTELEERWSPQINIGMSVLIPETYVSDLNVRMTLYRRLSDLETREDIEAFAAEMIDRFGEIPEEAENLLDIVAIKQLCKKANIAQVEAGPKGVLIGFYKDTPANPDAVLKWLTEKRGMVTLRPDQKLVAPRAWESAAERVSGVKALIRELAALS